MGGCFTKRAHRDDQRHVAAAWRWSMQGRFDVTRVYRVTRDLSGAQDMLNHAFFVVTHVYAALTNAAHRLKTIARIT